MAGPTSVCVWNPRDVTVFGAKNQEIIVDKIIVILEMITVGVH